MPRYILAATVLLLTAACFDEPVPAMAASCELEEGETRRVRSVVDGDTVTLDDGRDVRFTGIQAPKLPLGRAGFQKWPFADEAYAAMDNMADRQMVTLRYGGERIDRHGRALAHVFVRDGEKTIWLQQEMLRRGLARVYTFRDNDACADALFEAEHEAREAGRGIWADPYYRILDAQDIGALDEREGRYELVEGRVASASVVRGRIYLNFGDDYRTDFTVTVNEKDARAFLRDDTWSSLLPVASAKNSRIEGRRLRVRGWLEQYNGPSITVTHPAQIEFLE